MPWNDVTEPRPERSRAELLALVYEKARSRGKAKRLQTGLAVAIAVLLVGGLASFLTRENSRDSTKLRAVGGVPTFSVPGPIADTTTTAVPGLAPPTVVPPLPTVPGAPSPGVVPPSLPLETKPDPAEEPVPAPSDAVTDTNCRDSYDPACGPFAWDPPPGPNQPLTVSVAAAPASPKAGDTVTFRVVVDDADSVVLTDCLTTESYGDGLPTGMCVFGGCRGRFGPWTPVARPSHVELTFEHVYASAGIFVARFGFLSGFCDGSAAYSSQGEGAVTVVIS